MSDQVINRSRSSPLFGYPFEVRSSLSRERAKAALRQQKVGWFDPKRGPRGWILGSLLCLQWSALGDRGARLVLARITDDGLGSRIRGRAGFDFASLCLMALVTWIVIFSIYGFALQIRNFDGILLFNAVILLIFGAVLWSRLVCDDNADLIIRFIRRVLESPAVRTSPPAPSHFDRTPVQSAKLNVAGQHVTAPSEDDLAKAILAMQPGNFLIIDFGSNAFMQTALEYDRFILEKCEGSDHELYRAKGDFESNEIITAMTAYLRGSRLSKAIAWEKVRG